MGEQLYDTVVGALRERMNRQLLYYLDTCTRCGICKDACHQYVATGDAAYLPARRAEMIRGLYRRSLTWTGRFAAAIGDSPAIDERWIDDLYQATYSCTGCRRCMYYCPFSVDNSWVLATAKAILLAAGRTPPIMSELSAASIFKGENIAMLRDDVIDVLRMTEQDLQRKTGDPTATIPVDRTGADLLYVSLPGAYSILPAALIFHQARARWTLSLFEPANFGYFLGDTKQAIAVARRIVDEARRLQVKEVVIAECGHGYRVMRWLCESWSRQKHPFRVRCILEVMAEYVREGRITLRPGTVREPTTYHDPCQLARNGGIFEEPRDLLHRITTDFRELTPNRERNWCCGGGGGLHSQPELEEFRLKSGERKVEQIRRSGARIVVAPCDNCRLQLEDLGRKHALDIQVRSVMELVADAMVVPAAAAHREEEHDGPMPERP